MELRSLQSAWPFLVPYLDYLGALLMFIDALMIIFGVEGFKKAHATYAAISVIFDYILTAIISIILGFSFGSMIANLGPTSNDQAAIKATVVAAMAMGSVAAFAIVLIVFQLVDGFGKHLLGWDLPHTLGLES